MASGFDLPKRLPVARMAAGKRFLRIHAGGREALWFGPKAGHPPLNRFDDPEGSFRVCYLGASLGVCFAETFLRNPPVRILGLKDLESRSLSTIEVTVEMRLVRLHGPGLAKLGVTGDVAGGDDYSGSQTWSRMVWQHRDQVDGILYRPRHDDSALCAAIFDRAGENLKTVAQTGLAADPHAVAKLLRRYGLGITF